MDRNAVRGIEDVTRVFGERVASGCKFNTSVERARHHEFLSSPCLHSKDRNQSLHRQDPPVRVVIVLRIRPRPARTEMQSTTMTRGLLTWLSRTLSANTEVSVVPKSCTTEPHVKLFPAIQ